MTDSQKLDLILVNVNNPANIVADMVPRLDNLERTVADMIPRLDNLERTVADMVPRLDNLERTVADMVPRLDNLERTVADMIPKVNKIDAIESGITEIKLTLENEIRTNIVRVAEGHLDLYRKFDDAAKIDNEKEIIAIRVNILETELRRIKNRLDQIA